MEGNEQLAVIIPMLKNVGAELHRSNSKIPRHGPRSASWACLNT